VMLRLGPATIIEKSLALRALIEVMFWRKSCCNEAKSVAADNPISAVGALSCGTWTGAPTGSKIVPVESMYLPAKAPIATRGVTEIVTELENQLRETSASATHESDVMLRALCRGSIRAILVPISFPIFLSTAEI